jgi:hypothetical protein
MGKKVKNKETPGQSFSNGKWHISVTTVGEMVRELSKLDPALPVECSLSDGVDLVVFNRGQDTVHLGFGALGDWVDDE